MADIISTIRSSIDDFKNAEKRVAETILNNPTAIIKKNITELAHEAATSEATVVRFCRKIGLKGYIDLRVNLARALPPLEYTHENVDDSDSPIEIFEKMMRAVQGAIEDTKNKLDIQTLNKSVQILSNADRIDFCGAGKSGIIAKLAHHKFFLLGVPCTAYSEPYMQAMAAYMVSANSATVVISATGVTRTTIECAKAARESGATVIGVIGPERSKLANYCDTILPVYSREAAMWFAPQTTRIVQIAILDALFVSVAIRKFGSVKENLEEVNKEVFSY